MVSLTNWQFSVFKQLQFIIVNFLDTKYWFFSFTFTIFEQFHSKYNFTCAGTKKHKSKRKKLLLNSTVVKLKNLSPRFLLCVDTLQITIVQGEKKEYIIYIFWWVCKYINLSSDQFKVNKTINNLYTLDYLSVTSGLEYVRKRVLQQLQFNIKKRFRNGYNITIYGQITTVIGTKLHWRQW